MSGIIGIKWNILIKVKGVQVVNMANKLALNFLMKCVHVCMYHSRGMHLNTSKYFIWWYKNNDCSCLHIHLHNTTHF